MPKTLMPTPDRPPPDLVAYLPRLAAMLEEQRRFRLDQLSELATHGACVHRGDPARGEVTAALVAAAHRALDDIEAALARLRAGRYGICVRCDGRIPLERLSVIPQTGLCVACQRSIG